MRRRMHEMDCQKCRYMPDTVCIAHYGGRYRGKYRPELTAKINKNGECSRFRYSLFRWFKFEIFRNFLNIFRNIQYGKSIEIWGFKITRDNNGFTVEGTILGPDERYHFAGLEDATRYICQNGCNPIDADILYDCESCPLNNWLKGYKNGIVPDIRLRNVRSGL